MWDRAGAFEYRSGVTEEFMASQLRAMDMKMDRIIEMISKQAVS